MEDNKYEEQSIQESDIPNGSSEHVQVPSSLLPTVLQRLGLTPEQARPEPSLDDLQVQLKSDDWVMRVAAVRAIGKLDGAVASELLLSALDDPDSSVRAAAVLALGNMGKRIPLHRLVAALRDTDWHVRETAVLALAKQGPRVPKEVVMTALHDADAAVREAAQFVLYSLATAESASAPYGKLWEHHTMQHDEYTPPSANNMGTHLPLDNIWNGIGGRTGQFQGVREQEQAYAPGIMNEDCASQDFASYEDSDTLSSHGGKLVLHRHRSQKGWWVALAAVAVLFFLLGSGVTAMLVPVGAWMIFPKSEVVKVMPTKGQLAPFENPDDAWVAQNDIARSLHLPPQKIISQLKQGRSMTDIAAAQGVSPSQLHDIELKAMRDLLDNATRSGEIDQQQSDSWIQQFLNNPPLLEKMVMVVFSVGSNK
jgi:HEAT repeat protein